jgi:Tfp pilus assembly PilM family ATPase
MRPLAFKLESQAIARALVGPGETGAFIIVAVREGKTIVAIVSGRIVQFSATVPVGGHSISESLKKNFSVDDKTASGIRAGTVKKEKDEVLLSLANSATILRDEISRLIAYWQSHSDEKRPIEKILICGSDALLGLDDYLIRSLDIPAVIALPWHTIAPVEKYLPPLSLRQSLDYVAALGLCLGPDSK